MNKNILATAISATMLMGSSMAFAQEYHFVINYALAGSGGGGGTTEPAPSEPVSNDPGDPTVWEQYAMDNGLSKMTDPYFGYEFAYLQLTNLTGDPLPAENYPSITVEQIDIDNSPALSNIDSLRSISGVTNNAGSSPVLKIVGNVNLQNINGLSNLSGPTAYQFLITDNPLITSLQPLSGATLFNVSSGRGVDIQRNDALTSIDGIEAILDSRHPDYPNTNILQSVRITDNPMLSDVSALASLPANSSNFSNNVNLSSNAISDITSLSHITNFYPSLLDLSYNAIVDPSPLDGITMQSYAKLDFSGNSITKTNDFSVENFGPGAVIDYSNNPVDDISGVGAFVPSGGEKIILDDRAFTTKMLTTSNMCQLDGSAYVYEAVLEKTGGLGTFAYSEVCAD